MYKIYKSKEHYDIYYYLCDENLIVIKWFYMIENIYVSGIFHNGTAKSDIFHNGTMKLSSSKECIYETPDLQEAINQLERIMILLNV